MLTCPNCGGTMQLTVTLTGDIFRCYKCPTVIIPKKTGLEIKEKNQNG